MRDSTNDFDPTDTEARDHGYSLFEEGMTPGSAMAHRYRGERHHMKL